MISPERICFVLPSFRAIARFPFPILTIMADSTEERRQGTSQTYLSTRGGDYGRLVTDHHDQLSFETVVLKGLAQDGGLFLPEEIPAAKDWESWKDLSYPDLALKILSLYISTDEVPTADLKDIIDRSYSTFRSDEVTPLVHLRDNLHLLELFHGPSYSFKDCALQFLGNLFEYFLTGSAAIYGLRGKKDVSVFILHPKGRISPLQERQMTTVLDDNVHNMAVTGTFDDCQDIVKALFADPETNSQIKLGAVNSINWARILAQIVYYFKSYFALAKSSSTFKVGDKIRAVVPTGNFGDILAGYFARRMGLPIEKLVIATNENDILDRFWKTGKYEKQPASGPEAEGGLAADGVKAHEEGARETLSPAMDILVSSNFERLLWYLAYEFAATTGMDDEWSKKQASQEVTAWLKDLKTKGGFGPVYIDVLESARRTFDSERVDDAQTLETIKKYYEQLNYVLDPHTAVGITASERSIEQAGAEVPHISLSTAHPAKFAAAVNLALKEASGFSFDKVIPAELDELSKKETRVTSVDNSWQKVREIVVAQVDDDLKH
ncbi:Threonine synthase [Paramyrothecium foliicola]|nr:Threonine synthase [Paramyrothecium foliicola]